MPVHAAAKPDQASSWRYSARDGGSQSPASSRYGRRARPMSSLSRSCPFHFSSSNLARHTACGRPKLCSDTNDKNQVAPSRPLPRAHRLAIESKPPAGCSRSALDQDHNTPVATAKASCRAAN